MSQTQRNEYAELLIDKYQIEELRSNLELAEQRIAADLVRYDEKCADQKRGFFKEIADSFSELF